jgi:Ca2+-binding EF-hand superfamily protein
MGSRVLLAGCALLIGALAVPGAQLVSQPDLGEGESLGNLRFRAMDRNGDGIVTRQEWQGPRTAFEVHDWNGDGVLSGAELEPGARPRAWEPPGTTASAFAEARFERIDRSLRLDRFAAFDLDGNGVIDRQEWPGSRREFRNLDLDGDGVIRREELFTDGRAFAADRERWALFHRLDRDGDGAISLQEWPGSLRAFEVRDRDGDGVLSIEEMLALDGVEVDLRLAALADLDLDGDGVVRRVEWWGDPFQFDRVDRNGDGVVSRWELLLGWMLRTS